VRTFNQVVTVLVLVILLVLLPIIATIPDAVVQAVRNSTFAVEPWVATTTGRVVIGIVAAILWLLTIWLLWRELRRAPEGEVRVADIEGGTAQVDSSSVARLVEQRVASVPSVRKVNARVRPMREGVAVDLILATADGVMVPEVTRSAIARARQTLEQEIGARVADIDVRVREVGLGGPSPVAAPAPPPPPPVAPPPTVTRPEEEAPEPLVEPEPFVATETEPYAEMQTTVAPLEEEVMVEAPEEEFQPTEMAQEITEPWEAVTPTTEVEETEETDVIYVTPAETVYSEPCGEESVEEEPEEGQRAEQDFWRQMRQEDEES
jgi:uncharacterized alkaline shock family protein YloU